MIPIAPWHGMTREQLEREYSPRLLVADLQPYLDQYAKLSATARAAFPVERDLAYGATPAEVLDFFPAESPGSPVQVFIHGGYWRLLGKDESSFAAPAFVRRGAGFVALNYALAPAARLDEIVRQCRSAIAWVYRNASRFNCDPDRIYASGTSAGGHLVGMLLATEWHKQFAVPDDVLKGGCAVSGIFELEPILQCAVNDTLRLDLAQARRNSPMLLVRRTRAELVLAWAEVETAEWKRQNLEFAERWQAVNGPCTAAEIPGRNHFDVIVDLNDPDSRLGHLALAQMGLA